MALFIPTAATKARGTRQDVTIAQVTDLSVNGNPVGVNGTLSSVPPGSAEVDVSIRNRYSLAQTMRAIVRNLKDTSQVALPTDYPNGQLLQPDKQVTASVIVQVAGDVLSLQGEAQFLGTDGVWYTEDTWPFTLNPAPAPASTSSEDLVLNGVRFGDGTIVTCGAPETHQATGPYMVLLDYTFHGPSTQGYAYVQVGGQGFTQPVTFADGSGTAVVRGITAVGQAHAYVITSHQAQSNACDFVVTGYALGPSQGGSSGGTLSPPASSTGGLVITSLTVNDKKVTCGDKVDVSSDFTVTAQVKNTSPTASVQLSVDGTFSPPTQIASGGTATLTVQAPAPNPASNHIDIYAVAGNTVSNFCRLTKGTATPTGNWQCILACPGTDCYIVWGHGLMSDGSKQNILGTACLTDKEVATAQAMSAAAKAQGVDFDVNFVPVSVPLALGTIGIMGVLLYAAGLR